MDRAGTTGTNLTLIRTSSGNERYAHLGLLGRAFSLSRCSLKLLRGGEQNAESDAFRGITNFR
jgi:hypothetical protein